MEERWWDAWLAYAPDVAFPFVTLSGRSVWLPGLAGVMLKGECGQVSWRVAFGGPAMALRAGA